MCRCGWGAAQRAWPRASVGSRAAASRWGSPDGRTGGGAVRALAGCGPPRSWLPGFDVPRSSEWSSARRRRRSAKVGRRTFLTSVYAVSPSSDRMGCRLEGPAIEHVGAADIISDWIPLGGIQVPGNGKPIVLLADRQTTGGLYQDRHGDRARPAEAGAAPARGGAPFRGGVRPGGPGARLCPGAGAGRVGGIPHGSGALDRGGLAGC